MGRRRRESTGGPHVHAAGALEARDLLAAAGGTAAVVTQAIARPGSPIAGTVPINRDHFNQPLTFATGVINSTNNQDVFTATSDGSGTALTGFSATGIGVNGGSGASDRGVFGGSDSGHGVHGSSNSSYGVFGEGGGLAAIHGEHAASGVGVEGTSGSGPGVYGFSSSGRGVKGAGRVGVQGDVGPTQTAVHGFTLASWPRRRAPRWSSAGQGTPIFDRSGVVSAPSGSRASRVMIALEARHTPS